MIENKDIQNEEYVIAGLLSIADPNNKTAAKILKKLQGFSMLSEFNQSVLNAIRDLSRSNSHFDLLSIDSKLEHDTAYVSGGGIGGLGAIARSYTGVNALSFADKIIESSVKRHTIGKLHDAFSVMNEDPDLPLEDKLSKINLIFSEIQGYAAGEKSRGLRHSSEIITEWLDLVERRIEGDPDALGVSSGIPAIDAILGPKLIKRGSLIVVGARPKMGKTTLITAMSNHYATVAGAVSLFFSMEMTEMDIMEKMIADKGMIDPDSFYDGSCFDDAISNKTISSTNILRDSKLYIDDTPSVTLEHIQHEVRRMKVRHGKVGFIAIDYLTLMTLPKHDRHDLSVGEVTKKLKELAKEVNGVLVLLTQLNRNLEQRPDKRPFPSDSRDSGQIEQDCDMWIGIYKDSVYNEKQIQKGVTELIVRYNRNGDTGTAIVDSGKGMIYPATNQVLAAYQSSESNKLALDAEQEKQERYKNRQNRFDG